MIFLWIFLASIASIYGQGRNTDPNFDDQGAKSKWKELRPLTPLDKSDTVIENKNVNIIVNVDPKDVAKELWGLIQSRLDSPQGRKSLANEHMINELEKVVTPIIAPTRRSHRPTAFEIAYGLDHVTRKALLAGSHQRPTIQDEINTREIVARMMYKLKIIIENNGNNSKDSSLTNNYRRSMKSNRKNDNEVDLSNDGDFIKVILKIKKKELLKKAIGPSS